MPRARYDEDDLVGIRGEVWGYSTSRDPRMEDPRDRGEGGGAEIRRSARVIATMCACACVCETVNT